MRVNSDRSPFIMMKKRTIFNALFSLILSLFGYSSYAQETEKTWFETARRMAQATSQDEMRLILNETVPGFLATVEQDSKQNRELLNLWGLSRNIDESHLSDGTRTVPANVIQFLQSILKVQYDDNFVYGHAGLTHTYGYLMSNLQTPFGFKRARYVAGEIEAGFGFSEGLFSGLSNKGTLLSNLTHFAGTIAFRDHNRVLNGLKCRIPEIANYPYQNLQPKRLIERIRDDEFFLELRTDIVPFPTNNNHGRNTHLLIYSIDYHARGQDSQPRLITVFPVQKGFMDGVFAPSGLGEREHIRLKYNAAIPVSIPAEKMIGKRFIADEKPSN